MKIIKNKNIADILIGSVSAFLINIVGLLIFWFLFSFAKISLYSFVEEVIKNKLFGSVMTLSALPNILLFFLFLHLNYTQRAKGVLMYSFLMALLSLVGRFFPTIFSNFF